MGERGETGSGRKKILVAVLLLASLVLAVHGRSLGHGFVSDDHRLVEASPVARTLDPSAHLRSPFWLQWGPYAGYYRPAVTWSYAANRAIGGPGPLGFHLTNVLLHAAAAIALFLVVRRFASLSAALASAAVFAAHPVQAESVAWISGRTDVMAALFVLLATWAHAATAVPARRLDLLRHAGALSALAAALLSKETAILFPIFAVSADLASARCEGAAWRDAVRSAGRRALRLGPGYLAVIAGYLVLRGLVLGGDQGPAAGRMLDETGIGDALAAAGPGSRLLAAIAIAARYLGLAVYPGTLTFELEMPPSVVVGSALDPRLLLSVLGLAAAAALVVAAARRIPAALWGGLVAGGSLGISSLALLGC